MSILDQDPAHQQPTSAPAPDPDPGTTTENEPALANGGVAGIVAAAALLLIARLNRSWDFLNGSELDQAKALIALAAPLVAGFLIRGKVMPKVRADAAATFFHAVGYQQGLEENANSVIPDHVVAEIKARGVEESKAETARRRAETRAANADKVKPTPKGRRR